ncbi:MAG: hypothetical protein ACF8PN_04210 [Phycisphaerales bacterium]
MPPSEDSSATPPAPPTPSARRRVVVWLDPDQIDLVREVAERANLELTAAGSASGAAASTVAEAFAAERRPDLRQAVFDLEYEALWIATMSGIDSDDLPAIIEKAPVIVSNEPLADHWASSVEGGSADGAWVVPLFRNTATAALYDDLRESFGAVRAMSVHARGRRAHGSLYARLTDALDFIERVAGPLELIDAGLSGPLADPPATLRDMHGHIAFNARFPVNISACGLVSDLGGEWSRGATILGEGGCIRMTDTQFEWWDHDGRLVDSANLPEFDSAASVLADQIDRAIDARKRRLEPREPRRTVAACEAARLSLRTGQSESPRKLLEMATRS